MTSIPACADSREDCKVYRLGTHRTISPAETVARVRPRLGEMGITRVANVTGLDRIGIPVVTVCRPNSRSVAVAQGKGLDLDAAKASGLMEAVESYHAERIDHPLKLGSLNELRHRYPLIDVEALPPLAASRFHPNFPILWIEGRDLLTSDPVWLPYELVHSNYTLPLPSGSGCFVASTNGLASGNHVQEAIAHGIGEVIERDSTTLWNTPKAARGLTRINLATVRDESCRALLDRLERAGMSVAVWDTTTDVGVASFYCLITDDRNQGAHSGAGAGCHPAREVAFLRSVTEAIQVRTNYITGARDDLLPSEYTASGLAQKMRRAHALMVEDGPGRDFRDVPSQESDTFTEDVDWLLERLAAVGIGQVVAVDLTLPALELPVVRIVIPGMEGPDDHERYLPGARASGPQEGRP